MADLSIIIVSFNTAGELVALPRKPPRPPAVGVPRRHGGRQRVDRRHGRDRCVCAGREVRLIVNPRNVGFAAANNIGIRAVESELVLLLNSDTLVPAGAIDTLVAELRAQPALAAIGPRIVDPQGRVEVSFGPMMGPLNELRQKILVTLHARGVAPVSRLVDARASRPRQDRTGSAAPACSSGAPTRWRQACWTSATSSTRKTSTSARRCVPAARPSASRPSAEIVHLRGASRRTRPEASEQAYRRSQLAFYAKHHPGWAGLLRCYLRLRGKLPRPDGVLTDRDRRRACGIVDA